MHAIVEQLLTVIVFTTQTRISHIDHVYYMIKVLELIRSVSCVLSGILDTWNFYLSLRGLLGPFELIIESDICYSTYTYTLTMFIVHRHRHALTLTHKTTCKNLLKGKKPCGGYSYLFQGRVNINKRNSQVRTFSLMLS